MERKKKSQGKLQTLRLIKIKMQHTQTYGCNLKQNLQEKFIAVDVYISKEERSEINNLSFYLQTRDGWWAGGGGGENQTQSKEKESNEKDQSRINVI